MSKDQAMSVFANIDLDAKVDGRATFVSAVYDNGVERFEAIGTAKCRKDDHFEKRVGFNIAGARALQRLAAMLEEKALTEPKTEAQYQRDLFASALEQVGQVYAEGLQNLARLFRASA